MTIYCIAWITKPTHKTNPNSTHRGPPLYMRQKDSMDFLLDVENQKIPVGLAHAEYLAFTGRKITRGKDGLEPEGEHWVEEWKEEVCRK